MAAFGRAPQPTTRSGWLSSSAGSASCRVNEILKTSAAFFAAAELDRKIK